MNDVLFFEDPSIPEPDVFMAAGGGSHAQQTAKIMVAFEELCEAERPDAVLVVGDVNSTLACSIVAKKLNIPVAHVEAGLRSGEVRVNSGRAQAETRVAAGDRIRVPPMRVAEPSAAAVAAVPAREFPVLFEDEHLLAIDKPAGVAVHGGSGVSSGVIEQLRQARPQARYLELVHRLDKETSGVLLLAKKRSALTALQDQFRARDTGKVYSALVFGAWPPGLKVLDLALHKTLDAAGERHVRVVSPAHADGRRSITLVRIVRSFADGTLLDVTLKTGRTHQIRVHLAHSGHPIVGDPKYGDFARNKTFAREHHFTRMFLHARQITFDHPATGQRLTLDAPLPPECATLLSLSLIHI